MGQLLDPAREYRTRARHCIHIAKDLEGARRLVLLEMAQAWMRLADQATRNKEADVVDETTGPKLEWIPSPDLAPHSP